MGIAKLKALARRADLKLNGAICTSMTCGNCGIDFFFFLNKRRTETIATIAMATTTP